MFLWYVRYIGCRAISLCLPDPHQTSPCATNKCAEVGSELDDATSFWSWILSRKYPHFVEISTFCGYYLHLVYISILCGNINVLWIMNPFCGNISKFRVYINILWRLSAFCGNIHIMWILSAFCWFSLSYFTHIVKLNGASLLFLFVTQYAFMFSFTFPCFFLVLGKKIIPTLSGYMCHLFTNSIKASFYFLLNFLFTCCIGVLYTSVLWISCSMHALIRTL